MPNGDHVDTRPLWQRVKDMEEESRQERQQVSDLRTRVDDLEADKEALLNTIRLLKEED